MSFPFTQPVDNLRLWTSPLSGEAPLSYPGLYSEIQCTIQHLLPEELPSNQRDLTSRIFAIAGNGGENTHHVSNFAFLSVGTLFASKPIIYKITIIKEHAIVLYDTEMYCADCSQTGRLQVVLCDSSNLLEDSVHIFTSRLSLQPNVMRNVVTIDFQSPENSIQITEALDFVFSKIDTCLQGLHQPYSFSKRFHALVNMGAFLEIVADILISFKSEEAILRCLEKAKALYEALQQALPGLSPRSGHLLNVDGISHYLTTRIEKIDSDRLQPYYRSKAEQEKKERERAEYEEFLRWWNEVFFSSPELVKGYFGWLDEDSPLVEFSNEDPK
ncbi:MAG: hypothetical protein ACE5GN_03465 [Waddliaceae bacterium]